MKIQPLSIRLFPARQGLHKTKISGIAAKCDYIIITDSTSKNTRLVNNCGSKSPSTIFLSMRSPFIALEYFSKKILPTLQEPFTLISGSEDITIPNQLDKRWRGFNKKEKRYIQSILDHPHLKHWFAENLDEKIHPLLSAFPTGMIYDTSEPYEYDINNFSPPLATRELKVLCSHRTRKGTQWLARRKVAQLSRQDWNQWTTIVDQEVPLETFINLVKKHAFVLCVEGGGLDPSPKAWLSMLNGSIPIVRRTAVAEAYKEFPIIFVDEWNSNAITLKKLEEWHSEYSQKFLSETFKQQLAKSLSIDFWWDRVIKSNK